MHKIIYYNPKLKELARKLRQQGVRSEIKLWQFLNNKQLGGYDFHRQKPIDEYIVDFYSPDLSLVIEIDGGSHGDKIVYDQLRDKKLTSLGLTILHFSDSQVNNDIDAVLRVIHDWVTLHTPTPLKRGRYQDR
jgi:very-short-patch-repair endonuclease